jgi:hypothetical protein
VATVPKVLAIGWRSGGGRAHQPDRAVASSGESALPGRGSPTACPTEPLPTTLPADARCGFRVVPENRARANGRTIRLTVGIVPAASRADELGADSGARGPADEV